MIKIKKYKQKLYYKKRIIMIRKQKLNKSYKKHFIYRNLFFFIKKTRQDLNLQFSNAELMIFLLIYLSSMSFRTQT